MRVLVINCGSTTLKYKLFQERGAELDQLAAAVVETTGGYRAAVEQALAALPAPADVIAHRVVHGGGRLPDVVRIDAEVLRVLREVTPLAPMHNGPALEGIEATLGSGVPLVAALDTAFHATLPPRAWRYALPEIAGVRRYGFHGWSHRYVTERYAALTGSSEPTIITLHLGGGCSAAAILRGRSVDTSMGYSPLEGLVMGTRAGDLDPGILTHLLHEGMSLTQLEQLLQHEAGLRRWRGRRTCGSCWSARTPRPSWRSSSSATASRNTWEPTSPRWKGRRRSCSPVASESTRRRSGGGCASGSAGPG